MSKCVRLASVSVVFGVWWPGLSHSYHQHPANNSPLMGRLYFLPTFICHFFSFASSPYNFFFYFPVSLYTILFIHSKPIFICPYSYYSHFPCVFMWFITSMSFSILPTSLPLPPSFIFPSSQIFPHPPTLIRPRHFLIIFLVSTFYPPTLVGFPSFVSLLPPLRVLHSSPPWLFTTLPPSLTHLPPSPSPLPSPSSGHHAMSLTMIKVGAI